MRIEQHDNWREIVADSGYLYRKADSIGNRNHFKRGAMLPTETMDDFAEATEQEKAEWESQYQQEPNIDIDE